MCTVLLKEEELKTLISKEITYSSKERRETVSFTRLFDKPFRSEADFLSVRTVNNLLNTFPPVWNCRLKGFEVRYEDGYQLYMLVAHERGELSYRLGGFTYFESEDAIVIQEKK